MDDGACVGRNTDMWFPDTPNSVRTPAAQRALAWCKSCPVQTDCLQFALDDPALLGIWGGTTPEQRRGLRRTPTIVHGTAAGYHQHRNHGQQACEDCLRANREHVAKSRRRA